MEKLPRKWMMIVTTKDGLGNRFGNGTGEVKPTMMLSRGGSRETRANSSGCSQSKQPARRPAFAQGQRTRNNITAQK